MNGVVKAKEEAKEAGVKEGNTARSRGLNVQVPQIQQIMENIAYSGGDVSVKMTQTNMLCPDGTVIEEQTMNVWMNPVDRMSAEEARIRRLKGLQELAARLGRK